MDFHFANQQPLTWSGPAEKAKDNLAAIHLARQLAAEGRPATPQEQASLSRYVGWGHTEVLNYALDKFDLLTLLSEDEWDAVKASTLNAHYTALPVIAAIWRGFERLGAGKLDSLNVLDPSAGVGHFKSMMPESLRAKANWVEVELDQVTATILAALHPASKVFGMGYEQVNLPRGHFDIITSNVPFGNYPVAFDGLPRHLRTSIHDFFFARSLDLLRPGGVMAFITSRYTLDKKDDLVRKHLAEHCDLLAAVRLPNNAFASNAGTEVVTDLLFLRKRFAPNKELSAWADVRQETLQHHERDWAAEKFWLNRHYQHHPECVLGKPTASGTMYRNYEYTVLPDDRDLEEAISARLESFLPEDLLTEKPPTFSAAPVIPVERAEPVPVPEPARVTAMREIYRIARELLQAEVNLQPVTVLRQQLNQRYDDFVARYGFLNDPANTHPLKGEPELLFLKALEVQSLGTWLKADMFSKTTVRQANPVEQTDDPNDALLLCLDKLGRVDIPTIAEITGSSPEDVIRHLAGGRIFLDPETKQWVTDDRYLSGNVAAKLQAAQAAAMFDEQYQINVEALRLAQPEPLKADEIHAPLGAGWIPENDIEAFFRELLESQRISATYVPGTADWIVEIGYGVPSGVRSRWSTARVDLEVIVTDTLNSRQTVVYDLVETPDGKEKRVVNHDATVAAQARQAELKAAFDNWVWMNVERTERLVALYNKRYNIWRTPRFDGAHLTFPGLNTDISLRRSQRNGAWRILQHQAALMFHQVGSGKTLTAIVAAMESRRLGLARKVMAVVPNQVVGQWEAETLRAYPSSRILTVSSGDFSKSKRGTFLSRIATGDWDLILVPYSVFKLLPMSAKAEIEFIEGQVAELEKYLWELKAQSEKKESVAAAIKSIERSKRAFEARLFEKKRMAKDSPDTITYEMLGVDMLVVDEFHCLPYEARVLTNRGLLPIGEIVEKKLPVLVKSVDLSTNEVKWMPVTGWFKNSQSAPMVRVEHEKGYFECTANHKVWTEEHNYVEAGKLSTNHTLKNLSSVQTALQAQHRGKTGAEASALLQDMPEEWRAQNRHQDMPAMQCGIQVSVNRLEEQQQAKILRKCLCCQMAQCSTRTYRKNEGVFASNVGGIPSSHPRQAFPLGIASNEYEQPQPNAGMESQDVKDYVGTDIPCERRKRDINSPANSGSQCTWVTNRVSNPNQTGEESVQIFTNELQGGYCRPGQDACHRDRRSIASHKEVEVPGPSKNRGVERSRVVRVTFLESEGGFRSAVRAGRDQKVYCLEVAGTHNFFAEGILVSNCFKNLFFKTRINRIAGLPNSESQRAFDMYMKTRWSIQRGGKVVALTGTPVSNTLAEAFTMQRYLQEHALAEMGLSLFDAWAYQYAQAEPGIEMTPDGSGFRMNTRFRRFKNLSDLYAVFLQVTDPYAIQNGDIPGMPELYAGGLVKVKCKRDPRLRAYTLELGERTERIKSGAVKPEQDNMLKVSSDGRKAALDVSLVLASDPNGPMPKVDELVETVAAIHRMSTPMRGAQLVFCDLATPKARKAREAEIAEEDDILTGEEASLTTDIYAQIKRRLARRGIPEAEIAFAHDAKSTEQKTALYKAVNEGRKRVVIASTEKMGVGVNVQQRLLAVHHLTPTWRPDGLRQRTGRMERPGNRYGEVFEFVYVTPGSFDGFMWQNLEAKLGFIKDLERGLVQREADDIGDDVVSYATIKAMSSGNPLMLKKVELDSQMHRLEALRREWLRARTGMAREKGYVERRIPETEACIRFLEADLAQREQTGKEFSATIGDVTYTEREAAGKALRQAAQMHREAAVIGAYRGLKLVGMTRHAMGQLGFEPEQVIGLALSNGDILEANSEVTDKGLFASLDAALRSLDKKLEQARQSLVRLRADLLSLEGEIGKAWEHDEAYEKAAAELAAINAELDRWSRQQSERKDGENQDIDLSVVDNDDGWLEVFESALARIDEMHQQPIEVELPEPAIPVTPESIEQARQQVARSQAQLDFMQAVASVPQPLAQMSMFGEVVPVKTERRKRTR